MALIKFENEDKLFIKFFLLDSSVNMNQWGVTRQAMLKGLSTFIGKPFVLTPDYGHPNAVNGDDLLVQQEKYRVGDIIDIGVESRTGKAYGIAEITNSEAKDILKNGTINFVSPSIVFNTGSEVTDREGNNIITEFEGAHVAGVAEPAYGIDKAEIKGKCVGSRESCDLTLQKVEATVSECGNYLTVKKAGSKKKDAEDVDITMPRKRKDPVKTNTDKTLGKAKKTQKELDEDYEVQMQSFKKKDMDKEGVTEEKYKEITDKVTSNKGKKLKNNNNMTNKKGVEEEERKKDEEAEDETPEDDRVKRGESLDEQYKDKEETDILKSEEEDEDEKEEAEEEDKDKEEAEDPDKLDLTDKQKKFLKESKLAKEVKSLRAELKAMKSKIRKAEVEPIIDAILDAKKSVGTIDARSEYRKLSKMSIGTLKELKAEYDTISQVKTHPRYVVKQASLNGSDKSGDNILLSMRGEL